MFEFTESVEIRANPKEVWQHLSALERWWLPSNPEHISLEVRSTDGTIRPGTKIAFQERIAGIKGSAVGTVTRWNPEKEAACEGTAIYGHMGLHFPVREGVSWQVEDVHPETSVLSARVWAQFPSSLFGRVVEWYSRKVLNVVDRDRQHARRELTYLKQWIESGR